MIHGRNSLHVIEQWEQCVFRCSLDVHNCVVRSALAVEITHASREVINSRFAHKARAINETPVKRDLKAPHRPIESNERFNCAISCLKPGTHNTAYILNIKTIPVRATEKINQ